MFPNASNAGTPKRKRPDFPFNPSLSTLTGIDNSSSISGFDSGIENPENSPRTRVAYNFQGLKIDDAPISKLDLKSSAHDDITDESAARKRIRSLESKDEGPEALASLNPEIRLIETDDSIIIEPECDFQQHAQVHPNASKSSFKARLKRPGRPRSPPSVSRLPELKSGSGVWESRAGTSGSATIEVDTKVKQFVDPERAALTWQDDEITGHHPTDPDDDGTGINGVGFRPTAAQEYARKEKRRAQMADYKSREAREARAKRSERRRGNERAAVKLGTEFKPQVKRSVRFREVEVNSSILT